PRWPLPAAEYLGRRRRAAGTRQRDPGGDKTHPDEQALGQVQRGQQDRVRGGHLALSVNTQTRAGTTRPAGERVFSWDVRAPARTSGRSAPSTPETCAGAP